MDEKDKEIELLKVDNDLLKSKWVAQGLMIQKLHEENKHIKTEFRKIEMLYWETLNELEKLKNNMHNPMNL